jgi:hypothetical protein
MDHPGAPSHLYKLVACADSRTVACPAGDDRDDDENVSRASRGLFFGANLRTDAEGRTVLRATLLSSGEVERGGLVAGRAAARWKREPDVVALFFPEWKGDKATLAALRMSVAWH